MPEVETRVKRKIFKIIAEKCNGCGWCRRGEYCPTGAIIIEEKDVVESDEKELE